LRGAKAIFIADACRSGKLSGSEVQGPSLTAEELSKKKSNEIRILSCKPDQKSLEDLNWGGGRGLFSFYLLNGLKGMADSDGDERITLEELEDYIKPKVREISQAVTDGKRQDPVFDGEPTYWVATVDQPTMAALQQELNPAAIVAMASPVMTASEPRMALAASPLERDVNSPDTFDVFFNTLLKIDALAEIDLRPLLDIPASDIPLDFIETTMTWVKGRWFEDGERWIDEMKQEAITSKNNPGWEKRFNHRLAVSLHDLGQEMINLYIIGDLSALNQRNGKGDFDKYAALFSLALKLLDSDHPLYKALQVEQHYFAGVAARLKMPTSDDPELLKAKAIKEQNKALALDDKAAFIYNELGILMANAGKYEQAKNYYRKAIEYAPFWSFPLSNLCGVYAMTGDLTEGKAAADAALALQTNYYGVYNNLGLIYEKEHNYLLAEELYHISIKLDSSDYKAYERLGLVYMQTTQYAAAEKNLGKSAILKRDRYLRDVSQDGYPNTTDSPAPFNFNPQFTRLFLDETIQMYLDIIKQNPNDIEAHFELGRIYDGLNNYAVAKKYSNV